MRVEENGLDHPLVRPSVTPVSYTHLDVYKRQPLGGSSLQNQQLPDDSSSSILYTSRRDKKNAAAIQKDTKQDILLDDFNSTANGSQSPSISSSSKINTVGTPSTTLLDFDDDSSFNASNTPFVNGNNNINNNVNSSLPVIPISHIELSGYAEFRNRGTQYFKNGDYVSSFQEYEKSLNTLPVNHPLRIIAYSNIIASELKIGEYSKSLKNSSSALEMFPDDTAQWTAVIQDSDPQRTYKDIWPKVKLRQAEALEHIESFKAALSSYQELIEKGFANDKIMDGKRRCQKVLNPTPPPVVKTPRISTPKQSPSPVPRKATSNSKDAVYESVERLKKENATSQEVEKQKLALYDKVFAKVETWKNRKDTDIRHLLANLSIVLTWCDWKPVAASDLVMPKKVKITYMKAVAKTHPDKVPESLELENKMIAENVFSVLSVAWDKFKIENNMS